jgi:hypothetical protein
MGDKVQIHAKVYAEGKAVARSRGEAEWERAACAAFGAAITFEPRLVELRFRSSMRSAGAPDAVAEEFLSNLDLEGDAYGVPAHAGLEPDR